MPFVLQTTVFFITSLGENNPVLEQAIVKNFPNDYLAISPNEWLVAASGTAKNISDTLGITDGTSGGGVVFSTSGYFGRANNQIWEWLLAKLGAVRNA